MVVKIHAAKFFPYNKNFAEWILPLSLLFLLSFFPPVKFDKLCYYSGKIRQASLCQAMNYAYKNAM